MVRDSEWKLNGGGNIRDQMPKEFDFQTDTLNHPNGHKGYVSSQLYFLVCLCYYGVTICVAD
jgi:hypothetical protein